MIKEYSMNKEYLEKQFLEALKKGLKFIQLEITVPGSNETDLIIIKNVNYVRYLNYIDNAYDDDLILKTCNEIRIKDVIAFNKMEI